MCHSFVIARQTSRLPARTRFRRRVIGRRARHRGAEWFPARAESRGAEVYARSKLAYKLIEHLTTEVARVLPGRTLHREGEAMAPAPRPDGIPGLLIDEIQLTGIFRTTKGYVAQVRSGTKSYLLREGDQLFDGDVVAIAKEEAVFKQLIQDPASPKPYREVVMTLRPQS